MVPHYLKKSVVMFELFSEGGPWGLSLLTVELICLLFAAWKAPAWVKEIGLLAPVTAFVYMLIGYSEAMRAVQQAGDISPALLAGGSRAAFILLVYALLIYAVSLVIRMLQKPRI